MPDAPPPSRVPSPELPSSETHDIHDTTTSPQKTGDLDFSAYLNLPPTQTQASVVVADLRSNSPPATEDASNQHQLLDVMESASITLPNSSSLLVVDLSIGDGVTGLKFSPDEDVHASASPMFISSVPPLSGEGEDFGEREFKESVVASDVGNGHEESECQGAEEDVHELPVQEERNVENPVCEVETEIPDSEDDLSRVGSSPLKIAVRDADGVLDNYEDREMGQEKATEGYKEMGGKCEGSMGPEGFDNGRFMDSGVIMQGVSGKTVSHGEEPSLSARKPNSLDQSLNDIVVDSTKNIIEHDPAGDDSMHSVSESERRKDNRSLADIPSPQHADTKMSQLSITVTSTNISYNPTLEELPVSTAPSSACGSKNGDPMSVGTAICLKVDDQSNDKHLSQEMDQKSSHQSKSAQRSHSVEIAPQAGRRASGRKKSVPTGISTQYVSWSNIGKGGSVKRVEPVDSVPLRQEITFEALPNTRNRRQRSKKVQEIDPSLAIPVTLDEGHSGEDDARLDGEDSLHIADAIVNRSEQSRQYSAGNDTSLLALNSTVDDKIQDNTMDVDRVEDVTTGIVPARLEEQVLLDAVKHEIEGLNDATSAARNQSPILEDATAIDKGLKKQADAEDTASNQHEPRRRKSSTTSKKRKASGSIVSASSSGTTTRSKQTNEASLPSNSLKTASIQALSSPSSKVESRTNDAILTELKAMKIASLQARNAQLEAEIVLKRAKLAEVTRQLKHPAADTVKRHIKLLHDYNDIRDVGQGLIGMIADNRGVRIGELYEEFEVGLKD